MASRFDGHSSDRWVARVRQGQFAAIPAPFTWAASVEFAHLINGYEVMGSVERLFSLYRRTTAATRTKRLDDVSAIDAWLTLFAAHRGYRHQGYGPNQDEERIFDAICEHLRSRLLRLTASQRAGILAAMVDDPRRLGRPAGTKGK